MAVKMMLDINGELFDTWEFRTIQRAPPEYDEHTGDLKWPILINKNATMTNYNDLVLFFPTEEEREAVMLRIKQKFEDSDTVSII